MSESNKNVLVTEKAREKMVKARAGVLTLPHIVGMAFGNGGVDSSGTVIPPSEGQTDLRSELLRKPIDGFEFPTNTTCRYSATIGENELVGEEISEIGLYDEDGDIVGIKTFTRKGKDAEIEQTYTLDDIF